MSLTLTLEFGAAPPPSGSPLPSTVTDTFVYDGVTYNLSAATRVGYTVTGEPVVEWVSGLQWVSSSEQSFEYTQAAAANVGPDLATAWVSGAEWQTGRNAVYGLGSELGSGGQPFDGRVIATNPPVAYADGRNIDPGRTGAPFAIPGAGTLAKAVYRPNAPSPGFTQFNTDRRRLSKYHHIHFVTTWPDEGCFAPNPWSATPGPADELFASDVTLVGLESYPITPNNTIANLIAILRMPIWHGWTYADSMRYFRASERWDDYGRDIARIFGDCCVALMSDAASSSEKRQIAEGLVQRAKDVVDRIEQGGGFQPGVNEGGHQSPWGPLVMVAALLTRNSARGQIFRDVLANHANSTSTTLPLGQSLLMTRAVTANDWRVGAGPGNVDGRAVPLRADETNSFLSLNPRVFQEGARWGSATSGGQPMNSRHAMMPYAQNALYAPIMMWWMVSKLGQRGIYDDAHMWPYYDFLVRQQIAYLGTVRWQDALSGTSYTPVANGQMRSENSGNGDFQYSAVLSHPTHGWNYAAQPTPAYVSGWAASSWVNRETRATNSGPIFPTPVRERWIVLRFNGDLAHDPTYTPLASAFTSAPAEIRVNGTLVGIPATPTPVAGGTARDAGTIRIFRDRIAIAIDSEIPAGATVTVKTNWAGEAWQPRTIDNRTLPDVDVSITDIRTPSTVAPSSHDAMSWGYGTGASAGQIAADPQKRFRIQPTTAYLSSQWGINTATSNRINRLLICFRNFRIPDVADISGGNDVNVLFRQGVGSSFDRRFALHPTTWQWRGGNPARTVVGPLSQFSSANNGQRIDVNILLDLTDGTNTSVMTVSRSIDGGAWSAPASGTAVSGTWTDANALNWQTIGTLFNSITGDNAGGSQGRSNRGVGWGDLVIHVESGDRLFGTLPALNSAQMTGALGNRGQNLLPARPDYPSGGAQGGIPEFYYRATDADVRNGALPNYGLFDAFLALRDNLPDGQVGIEPFVSYGSGS